MRGYKTTEMWMTVATSIIALLISYGAMTKEEGQLWLSLFASVLPVIIYTISRTWGKSQNGQG